MQDKKKIQKSFMKEHLSGTKVRVSASIELEDYSEEDIYSILNQIRSTAKVLSLKVAENKIKEEANAMKQNLRLKVFETNDILEHFEIAKDSIDVSKIGRTGLIQFIELYMDKYGLEDCEKFRTIIDYDSEYGFFVIRKISK